MARDVQEMKAATGLSRRLDAVRGVGERDGVADGLHGPHEARHIGAARPAEAIRGSWLGSYIGSVVYGGLDGIITTFAVVSGVAGADLGAKVILILGIGNLLADGFSMGTGDYLSTKSVREYYDREARRRRQEIESFPEQQKAALSASYRANGYGDQDADRLVEVHTRSPERWVSAMMIEDLGMVKEESNPLRNALATFGAFVVAGSLPLLVYLVGLATPVDPRAAFPISVAMSALALFGLGAAKVVVTRLNPLRSGLEMLVVGGFAATVAYVIGLLLKDIV